VVSAVGLEAGGLGAVGLGLSSGRANQGAAGQAVEGDAVLVQQSGAIQGNEEGTATDHRDFLEG
jgi:hypothetical protein